MGQPLFREEALRHHTRAREWGDVVRRPPRWTRVAYPIVVGIAVLAVAALVLGRAPHESSGPAVVRADGTGGERYTIEAFLPASLRNELKTGSPLRIESPTSMALTIGPSSPLVAGDWARARASNASATATTATKVRYTFLPDIHFSYRAACFFTSVCHFHTE